MILYNKYLQKLALFLAICLLFLPLRAQAAMTEYEIQQQLGSISYILQGLSQNLQSGLVSHDLIKAELNILSLFLNSFIIPNYASLPSSFGQDPPPGQVLGAFTESPIQYTQYPPPPPEAFVSINPKTGGSSSITTGGSSRTVLSFAVKPFYSDIEVRRVDVVFDQRMWLYAEEISLYSGGVLSKIVQPMSPSSFFEMGSGNYAVRFTDFSEKVSKDKTKTFSIKVKAREFIPNNVDVRVFLNNNSVRSIDQAGFQHTVPGTTGGIDGYFSREFRIKTD